MKSVYILLSVLLVSSNALALPTNQKITLEDIQFMAAQDGSYNFDGIVKLDNCSGALVRFENSKPSDKAMVMSNGHCVENDDGGFIQPGAFIAHKAVSRTFRFLNKDGSLSSNGVKSTQILYATMTGTDVSLYELSVTFAQITAKFNVNALTLESKHSVEGDAIDILSGYWEKGYSCNIHSFVFNLKEDAYTWYDSIRYTDGGCKTIHGTSGSPILSHETGKIIGINNTGNDDGEKCTLDNPCEVAQDGSIFYQKGVSYGQQTNRFYTCLNQAGVLDLNTKGCELLH